MRRIVSILIFIPIALLAAENKQPPSTPEELVSMLVKAIKQNKSELLTPLLPTEKTLRHKNSILKTCNPTRNASNDMNKRINIFLGSRLKTNSASVTNNFNNLRNNFSPIEKQNIEITGPISKEISKNPCTASSFISFTLKLGNSIFEISLLIDKSPLGWYIQNSHIYKVKGLVTEAIPPRRGLIYDRNGIVLANNKQIRSLQINPSKIQCKPGKKRITCLQDIIKRLRENITIKKFDLERFYTKHLKPSRLPRHIGPVTLRQNLNKKEQKYILAASKKISGLTMTTSWIRYYPYKNSLAHVVGYVSRPRARTKETWPVTKNIIYADTNFIGMTGIEKQYEKILHGQAGNRSVMRDPSKGDLNSKVILKPVAGRNIYLTLDVKLQQVAEKSLGRKSGAVVAIDTQSGEILALVSKPGFDPNLFVSMISAKTYRKLKTDRKRPLLARAIISTYPPGSTVKPFHGIGGLHFNTIKPSNTVQCEGKYFIPGVKRPWRDWKKDGHGKMTLGKAIMRSCDVYFYDLAYQMKIDKITKTLAMFGWGAYTGVDLPNEKSGILPSRTWKAQRFQHRKNKLAEKWYPGDTINVGIGQGLITITPLQLAAATTIIANRGKVVIPHLLHAVQFTQGKKVYLNPANNNIEIPEYKLAKKYRASLLKRRKALSAISKKDWDLVITGMVAAVHGWNNSGWGGTARSLIPITRNRFKIAGKTGAAQVFMSLKDEKYTSPLPKRFLDHALFIAFAPAHKPRIAIAVVVEHGGYSGTSAALVAGQVIQAFLIN